MCKHPDIDRLATLHEALHKADIAAGIDRNYPDDLAATKEEGRPGVRRNFAERDRFIAVLELKAPLAQCLQGPSSSLASPDNYEGLLLRRHRDPIVALLAISRQYICIQLFLDDNIQGC